MPAPGERDHGLWGGSQRQTLPRRILPPDGRHCRPAGPTTCGAGREAMPTSRRLRRLTIPAVGLLATLLALAPIGARANSVELRTTMMPATGCGVRSAHGGGPSGEA